MLTASGGTVAIWLEVLSAVPRKLHFGISLMSLLEVQYLLIRDAILLFYHGFFDGPGHSQAVQGGCLKYLLLGASLLLPNKALKSAQKSLPLFSPHSAQQPLQFPASLALPVSELYNSLLYMVSINVFSCAHQNISVYSSTVHDKQKRKWSISYCCSDSQ